MALVIFDLDDTLIHGDCATLWSEQMGRLAWVDPESFMRKNNELMDAYSQGKLAMEEFKDFSLEPMIGRTPEEIEHLVEPWVEDVIEPLIYSDATRTIARHRANGDRVLVISASGTPGHADCGAYRHRRSVGDRAGCQPRRVQRPYRRRPDLPRRQDHPFARMAGAGRGNPGRRVLLFGFAQ
jgi:hypothetical protein